MSRRGPRALVAGTVVVALTAALPAGPGRAAPAAVTAPPPAAAGPESTVTPPAPAGPEITTITLITGDRVTMYGGDRVSVAAGPGRAGIGFVGETVEDHHYVIPADALPLLRADRVDRRLFDVTALAEFGYDDRVGEVPLLVSYPGVAGRSGVRSTVQVDGVRAVRDLPGVGALAVRADREGRARLWGALTAGAGSARGALSGAGKLWLDGKRAMSLDVSVPQIGAPAAWRAGFDGSGVKVAVLDSGVDATHPDLAGQIAASQNFTDDPDADDPIGHGTHVASTIAGTGAASGGRYRGVAPGAKLLNGKVCVVGGCAESSLLAGMQWAAEQGAQVVNLSLGGADRPGLDPLEQAVGDLSARYGVLFVVAAGNNGRTASINSPGSADAALTVGAVDRDDRLADFSSRGPRTGDEAIKPDITAPGVAIVAAKAAHGGGEPAPVDGYVTRSGTSMATPHVAGAAAILTQRHPTWTAQQRKTALIGSAKAAAGDDVFGHGAGRVDVERATTQAVISETASISFGRQLWPLAGNAPVTRTLGYRNTGDTPVTLSLAATATDPGGAAAPADAFTLAASTVTVPAGGTASTTLTAHPTFAGPAGFYRGYVAAVAAGGVQVRTAFAVGRDPESYPVTLAVTDRAGRPAEVQRTALTNLATGERIDVSGAVQGGSAVARVPTGHYGLVSQIVTGRGDDDPTNDSITMLVQPGLTVDAARTVRLDARTARPVSVTVPTPDAVPAQVVIRAQWSTARLFTQSYVLKYDFDGVFMGGVQPAPPEEGFSSGVTAVLARPADDGGFDNSPYSYDLGWFRAGSMLDGFVRRLRPRDLATVEATYARQADDARGSVTKFASPPFPLGVNFGVGLPFDLPFRRTEYLNSDDQLRWDTRFIEVSPQDDVPSLVATSSVDDARYPAGSRNPELWNAAVAAPSVAAAPADRPGGWADRTGDTVSVQVPLYGDGQGRTGDSLTTVTRTALYRDGTLAGESAEPFGRYEVPPATAAYRLEASAERAAPHTLSTAVRAVWTFRSGPVEGAAPQRLPLSTVRFSPRVDNLNTLRAGGLVDVPVAVDRHAGSSAGPNRSLAVQVSFDDGRTWRAAPVLGVGAHRTVAVRHPRTPGFVSLRAQASDTAGNTVEQTVIRAYRTG